VPVLRAAGPEARAEAGSGRGTVADCAAAPALFYCWAVHRWDAEAASRAAPAPIEPALAADGIDEFFQFFTAWRRDGAEPLGGSVHVHATDGAGEWLVTESGERLAVSREHRRADAAARGTASELLLLLWRRLGLDAVEVAGDRAVLARLLARTDLD
jgi:hypothetical protein